jgi:hypothetical protein
MWETLFGPNLTAKQIRQLKIANRMFPYQMEHYDNFKMDICTTTINKINSSHKNNLYDVTFLNNETTIKFSGYIIDNRSKFKITYTFFNDKTAIKEYSLREHWGFSDIKFMPYTVIEGVNLYNDEGHLTYCYEKKKIDYNKTTLTHINGKEQRKVIANDPKRSGIETAETFYISSSEYYRAKTNIKNKTMYFSAQNGKEELIEFDLFNEKVKDLTSYREKVLIKKK